MQHRGDQAVDAAHFCLRSKPNDQKSVRTADTTGTRGYASLVASLMAVVLLAIGGLYAPASAQDAAAQPNASKPAPETQSAAKPKADVQVINIALVIQDVDDLPPISLLDFKPEDLGIAGATLGINDNNTTGRFLKQSFQLEQIRGDDATKLIATVVERADAGVGLFVVIAQPETILEMSDALKGKDAVLFNASATDLSLREENCRLNVKHTAPSRAMLVDALSQYLSFKRWRKLALVEGPSANDKKFAEAIRRSAKKFNLKIVEQTEFRYEAGSRRSDGGFEQVQRQIPTFTQNFPDYDVLIVADEAGQFGYYFPYRIWIPRPVAGTHGLYPTTWHPASELWGASQFQNRFQRLASRTMRPIDYQAWMAIRAIGEAATRTKSATPKTLIDYMLSDQFEMAAFKGQKLTFRPWNAQLRQPIFVATDKLHVTVSPQPGFLHRKTILDTLGLDEPETKCTVFKSKS